MQNRIVFCFRRQKSSGITLITLIRWIGYYQPLKVRTPKHRRKILWLMCQYWSPPCVTDYVRAPASGIRQFGRQMSSPRNARLGRIRCTEFLYFNSLSIHRISHCSRTRSILGYCLNHEAGFFASAATQASAAATIAMVRAGTRMPSEQYSYSSTKIYTHHYMYFQPLDSVIEAKQRLCGVELFVNLRWFYVAMSSERKRPAHIPERTQISTNRSTLFK